MLTEPLLILREANMGTGEPTGCPHKGLGIPDYCFQDLETITHLDARSLGCAACTAVVKPRVLSPIKNDELSKQEGE